ncbi:hypothetical protein SYNPS1DRAFT_28782 [Syncephalis pseudoplumigaleata]|uniref:Uncharacterized protein n=1 Tax=Syncephalis pseudoplumigaleata TaxID=1712513 RepID=A0A4V1J1L6_9FUNG|nr:hypothetical protein SYNPS1DRAFT_28782 [Syncephalis pseudoplumigaleata]|eukprot:RKP25489.1 hypothetical protein SYNPS1DRAFT_28782 [Syncephalis pseudoplumigaleata]
MSTSHSTADTLPHSNRTTAKAATPRTPSYFTAGGASSIATCILLQPLDLLKTRLQQQRQQQQQQPPPPPQTTTTTTEKSNSSTSTGNATVIGQTVVVMLNSSELSANINHQPTRHQSANGTTAQKPPNPFTAANVAIAANVTAAAAETVDEVAVSRRFSGGVLVTVLFIVLAVAVSGMFLWRRKLDRYLSRVEFVHRWLHKRYAVVPHGEPLASSDVRRLDDDAVGQDTQYEMNHFQLIDDDDMLEEYDTTTTTTPPARHTSSNGQHEL